MNAQLEDQTQDTEVQDIAEKINDILQAAFDGLIERRDRQYSAALETLDAEKESLTKEHNAISFAETTSARVSSAQEREARREADKLTVSGQYEAGRLKLLVAEEAANMTAARTERIQQISARIEAIEAEKQSAARSIFRAWLQDCKTIIRPVEHGLFVTLLDGLYDSFYDFQRRTNTAGDGVLNTLFKSGDITALTAGEFSREWKRGSHWYSGRARR